MSDAHYDKVELLLPMSGADGGTVFTDYSTRNRAVTRFNATTSTTGAKDYASVGFFNGTSAYLRCDPVAAALVGATSFTIEGWFYRLSDAAGQDAMFGIHTSTGANRLVFVENQAFGTGFTTTSYTAVPVGAWYHFAAQLNAGTIEAFIDGVRVLNISAGTLAIAGTDVFSIGQEFDASLTTGDFFHGRMQDVRVTNGVARYTDGFTPPARLIGEISGTVDDDTDVGAVRRIVAFPRLAPTRVVTTQSASDGTFTLTGLPVTEHTVVYLDDDAGTLYNDLCHRVIPA